MPIPVVPQPAEIERRRSRSAAFLAAWHRAQERAARCPQFCTFPDNTADPKCVRCGLPVRPYAGETGADTIE